MPNKITEGSAATPALFNDRFAPEYVVTGDTYGATGDGTTNDRAAFVAAAAAAGTKGFTVPNGTYAIASDLTISVPIRLKTGAVLKPASGVTITIESLESDGPTPCFDESAGGAIRVAEGAASMLYPENWTNLSTGAAVRRCLQECARSGAKTVLSASYDSPDSIPFGGRALTGMLSLTNGSPDVVGTDTAFLSEVTVGEAYTFLHDARSDEVSMTVLSVTDDTHMTLSSNFTGDTATDYSAIRSGAYPIVIEARSAVLQQEAGGTLAPYYDRGDDTGKKIFLNVDGSVLTYGVGYVNVKGIGEVGTYGMAPSRGASSGRRIFPMMRFDNFDVAIRGGQGGSGNAYTGDLFPYVQARGNGTDLWLDENAGDDCVFLILRAQGTEDAAWANRSTIVLDTTDGLVVLSALIGARRLDRKGLQMLGSAKAIFDHILLEHDYLRAISVEDAGAVFDCRNLEFGSSSFYTKATGTITVTGGSATVTGSGTKFIGEITAGKYILVVEPDGTWRKVQVLSVASDTSLTLSAAWDTTWAAGSGFAFASGHGVYVDNPGSIIRVQAGGETNNAQHLHAIVMDDCGAAARGNYIEIHSPYLVDSVKPVTFKGNNPSGGDRVIAHTRSGSYSYRYDPNFSNSRLHRRYRMLYPGEVLKTVSAAGSVQLGEDDGGNAISHNMVVLRNTSGGSATMTVAAPSVDLVGSEIVVMARSNNIVLTNDNDAPLTPGSITSYFRSASGSDVTLTASDGAIRLTCLYQGTVAYWRQI